MSSIKTALVTISAFTAALLTATSCLALPATEEPESIVARVHDDAGQAAFDILQQDDLSAFSLEGVGTPVVDVTFLSRPTMGPVPGRTQWMQVVGILHGEGEGEDESYVVASSEAPWGEPLRVGFLSQDLWAYDELALIHRIEQGSTKRLMTVAAPAMAPGGGFTQPEESATLCTISDGAGSGTDCTVQYTDSKGTHTYEIAETGDLSATPPRVKQITLVMEEISGLVTVGDQCKFTGACSAEEELD